MEDFIAFLLQKVYNSKPISKEIIIKSLKKTILDVNYHFPDLTEENIILRIQSNSNELAIFLFRIGSELFINGHLSLLPQFHWLLKELCSCEIYFNNKIDEGFYVIHGEGTVIGSRNTIGKGFKIHQGCTIGHKKNNSGTDGVIVGNDVTLYSHSSILGNIEIGDNVVIGGHVLVSKSVPGNTIILSAEVNSVKDLKSNL